MTPEAYDAQLKALDAERQQLQVAYTTSQTYPRWAYHATEPVHLVYSDAEAQALGEGWSPVPLGPTRRSRGARAGGARAGDGRHRAPSFTLSVQGTGFTADAVIVLNGFDEPTTVVSDPR